MKILLISPNGLQELSGGGLYLRSLAQALCDVPGVSQVTVVSKDMGDGEPFSLPETCKRVYLEKNRRRDIAARLRLYPTYLVTHMPILVEQAHQADVVLFHNSRCGGLMARMRKQVPDKTFGVLGDNVEVELKRQHQEGNVLRQVSNAIDTWLIRRAEMPGYLADFMTFITEADRKLFATHYEVPARTAILPISLPRGQLSSPASVTAIPAASDQTTVRVLFTAHFGFEPNQAALHHFAEVASLFRKLSDQPVDFVVAGARAAQMAAPYPDLTVVDSPSPELMTKTFGDATLYLAPVSWGSGMKTKVAEALSFGLPVICMPNAAVGYEVALADARFNPAITVVKNAAEMASTLHTILQTQDLLPLRNAALAAFDALYSQASQTRRFELLLLAQ